MNPALSSTRSKASGLKAKVNAALAAQWSRPTTDIVHLELPLPISTNDLWRPDGRGGMCKTQRYATWAIAAGNMINSQKPGRVSGPYSLTLIINRSRSRLDLDNAVKAASDALQAHGVIDNDRQAEEIHLRWSDGVKGMSVFVERFRKEAA